jgi:Protein of unknown function (DUF2752)
VTGGSLRNVPLRGGPSRAGGAALRAVRSAARHPAAAPLGALAAAGAGAAYLRRVNPHQPGHLLPRCPFHWATGLLCPFCGGTRMAYDLLHGNWAAAPHDNAALLAVIPLALTVYLRWLAAGLRGRGWRPALGTRGTVAVVASAVGWAVVRNLVGVF